MITSTRNITRVFRETSASDRVAGRAWYEHAQDIARELDPESPERGAAVIAVLSPQTRWERNVELARLAYSRYAQGLSEPEFLAGWPGLHNDARKAYRILSGESPATVVSGNKVSAFWRNIADPSDPTVVVVDRHAFSVAAGHKVYADDGQIFLSRKGGYEAVAQQYRRAARILSRETGESWSPAQIQAATWEHARNEFTFAT